MPQLKLPAHYYGSTCYWAHMLTFRCTSRCPFCIMVERGRCRKTEELAGSEILRFWNGLEHPAGQRLSLIGGEPLLHPDIIEIVNGLQGYHVTITTNCKGAFFKRPDFARCLKPQKGTTLRVNTSFHPHCISAEEYIAVVHQFRAAGQQVGQTSYVNHPEVAKYARELAKVRKAFPLKGNPYLGFYSKQDGFRAAFDPANLCPNEHYSGPGTPAKVCGITDFGAYRQICGSSAKQRVQCHQPAQSLIIDPAGDHYHCHYKLYSGIDPVCNIKAFRPISAGAQDCWHYGFCSSCDVNRVHCKRNPTAVPLILTKLYDKREKEHAEIKTLTARIAEFAKKHGLIYAPSKWFEYAYLLLYSGHRHRGKVLEVGSAKLVLPYFLAADGYDVTIADIDYLKYQAEMGKKFGVKSLRVDLREPQPELVGQFDLISCLSVIEHVDQDTKAALNLAKCLRPGGVLVLSTDFFTTYLEYPDANRKIVTDRAKGTHTDSRAYTPKTFEARILKPLESVGLQRLGATDWQNVSLADPAELSVRGLYTFGISCLRSKP